MPSDGIDGDLSAAQTGTVIARLQQEYPGAGWTPRSDAGPYEILILTILSAQTTDRSVDSIRTALFSRYPTPRDLASAHPAEVEEIIRPTGYYHAKSRYIIAAAGMVSREFSGSVPETMEDLLRVPGVGRKTANIVLYHGFGKNDGIAVDTHVKRIAWRLGWTDATMPEQIEQDLMSCIPRQQWGHLTDLLIAHGRAICTARKPLCRSCPVHLDCRYHRSVPGKTATVITDRPPRKRTR